MTKYSVKHEVIRLPVLISELKCRRMRVAIPQTTLSYTACDTMNRLLDGFVVEPLVVLRSSPCDGLIIGGGVLPQALLDIFCGDYLDIGYDLQNARFHRGTYDLPAKAFFSTIDFLAATKDMEKAKVDCLDEVTTALHSTELGFRAYRTDDVGQMARYAAALNGGDIEFWMNLMLDEPENPAP